MDFGAQVVDKDGEEHARPLCSVKPMSVMEEADTWTEGPIAQEDLPPTCPVCLKRDPRFHRNANPAPRSTHTEFAASRWHEDPDDDGPNGSLIRKLVSKSGRLEAMLVVNYRPDSNRWQVSVTTHDSWDTAAATQKPRRLIEIFDLGDGVIQGKYAAPAILAAEQCFSNFIQDVASLDKGFRAVRGNAVRVIQDVASLDKGFRAVRGNAVRVRADGSSPRNKSWLPKGFKKNPLLPTARLKMSLGLAQLEQRATGSLQKMKLSAKNRGDIQSATISAGFYAKKMNQTMFVYSGNSYGSLVWRATYKPGEYLNRINNTGGYLYSVTPDLVVSRHEIQR